jgi:hypothetical protein
MVYSIQFSEDVNWYIGQIYILTSWKTISMSICE